MGSYTYHCVGQGPIERIDNKTYRRREYYAMNRVEIVQEAEKARKRGESIIEWWAQTRTGCRVLGDDTAQSWPVPAGRINLPKLVVCPVCQGEGGSQIVSGIRNICVVCNGSGICKKGNEKRWLPWQIERMKEEYA